VLTWQAEQFGWQWDLQSETEVPQQIETLEDKKNWNNLGEKTYW
jgi:hypothetical protein